ncbi:MAG: hypothetical protein Q8S73_41165 [Deltaproteobacteria bacterium]|nr:hypothetical protein [Myxococcales bacterium]MDP3220571.1 hypothetical protein [Deltaproteobacteria bacterium]
MGSRQQQRAAVRRAASLDVEAHVARVAAQLRRLAFTGLFFGREDAVAGAYMARCRVADVATGAVLLFTRDSGMHTSGWFKNPDYDRCLHLSLSPLANATALVDARGEPLRTPDLGRETTERWVRAFYGDCMGAVWAESPKTDHGRRQGVWHWRVFCDARWQPIVPRGEVYSMDFTDLGWRSASQVFEEDGRLVTSVLNPG